MKVMDERLYTNFKQYFPLFAEDAVSFTTSNIPCELIVKLTDGSSILYDDADRTIRNLPDDPHDLSKEECNKEFSYRLRKMMQIKGITQYELSERTGIAQPHISNYVRGMRSPSFYVIDKIAKALDCSIDQFRYY